MLIRDEICVSFLDVRPLAPGHALVVPIAEVDHWTDLDAGVASHLMEVAQRVGQAQREVFKPARIGLMIAGFEVPHAHVHVVPMESMSHLDFANANANPDPAALDDQHARLLAALGG